MKHQIIVRPLFLGILEVSVPDFGAIDVYVTDDYGTLVLLPNIPLIFDSLHSDGEFH